MITFMQYTIQCVCTRLFIPCKRQNDVKSKTVKHSYQKNKTKSILYNYFVYYIHFCYSQLTALRHTVHDFRIFFHIIYLQEFVRAFLFCLCYSETPKSIIISRFIFCVYNVFVPYTNICIYTHVLKTLKKFETSWSLRARLDKNNI